MKTVKLATALFLAFGAQSASAVFFIYTPDSSSVMPVNKTRMPSIKVEAPCCSYVDTTFDVSWSEASPGAGGSIFAWSVGTLTTNAATEVIAWSISAASGSGRYGFFTIGSSNEGGVFSEWAQVTPGYIASSWVSEGPVYFSTPGVWTLQGAPPVPEPGSAWLALGGLGVLLAARRRGSGEGVPSGGERVPSGLARKSLMTPSLPRRLIDRPK